MNPAVRQGKSNRRRNVPRRASVNSPGNDSQNHPPYWASLARFSEVGWVVPAAYQAATPWLAASEAGGFTHAGGHVMRIPRGMLGHGDRDGKSRVGWVILAR